MTTMLDYYPLGLSALSLSHPHSIPSENESGRVITPFFGSPSHQVLHPSLEIQSTPSLACHLHCYSQVFMRLLIIVDAIAEWRILDARTANQVAAILGFVARLVAAGIEGDVLA